MGLNGHPCPCVGDGPLPAYGLGSLLQELHLQRAGGHRQDPDTHIQRIAHVLRFRPLLRGQLLMGGIHLHVGKALLHTCTIQLQHRHTVELCQYRLLLGSYGYQLAVHHQWRTSGVEESCSALGGDVGTGGVAWRPLLQLAYEEAVAHVVVILADVVGSLLVYRGMLFLGC